MSDPFPPPPYATVPNASSGDRPDPWTPQADALADTLRAPRDMRDKSRRRDQLVGVAVTVSLVSLAIVLGSGAALTAVAIAVPLVAVCYVSLRARPRAWAIQEATTKLEIIDPHCEGCGYSLRHLRSDRCPECARRAPLPMPEQIDHIVQGGSVLVPRGSLESDLGWVAALTMALVAVVLGKLASATAGVAAMGVTLVTFILTQNIVRYRQGRRVPEAAVCDACGQTTSIRQNHCEHCGAAILAEHVYVRPGMRGSFDPRLFIGWAQVAAALAIGWMLMVLAAIFGAHTAAGFNASAMRMACYQPIFAVAGVLLVYVDHRRRTPGRLRAFGLSLEPLCHHCLGVLKGQPPNGHCPHCRRPYRAIELAGGRSRSA